MKHSTRFRPFFLFLLSGLTTSAITAPLDVRTFSAAGNIWMADSSRLMVYAIETENLRQVTLKQGSDNDSLVDAVRDDEILWVSARSGLFAVNLASATVEQVSLAAGVVGAAKLAVDADYLWLYTGTAFWRYDKLGREWLSYDLPTDQTGHPLGLTDDGTNIYVVTTRGVHVFSVSDEKWTALPIPGDTLAKSAIFRIDNNDPLIIDDRRMVRFSSANLVWETVSAPGPIVDIAQTTTSIWFCTARIVGELARVSAMVRYYDVHDTATLSALTLRQDTLFIPCAEYIISYHPPSQAKSVVDREGAAATASGPVIIAGDKAVLWDGNVLTTYTFASGLWQRISGTALPGQTAALRRASWDNNGLAVRYSAATRSVLSGALGFQNLTLRTAYEPDTTFKLNTTTFRRDTLIGEVLVTSYRDPVLKASPSIHTTFPGGRSLDVFLNNEQTDRKPAKGIDYQGGVNDVLDGLTIGTNAPDALASRTLPPVNYEGGLLRLGSTTKLAGRDRKIVRSSIGAGFLTRQTRRKTFAYAPDGKFRLALPQDSLSIIQIVPGSAQVKVDGESVASDAYSFGSTTGTVSFYRLDLIDPSSIIEISYTVETLPLHRVDELEIAPANSFGEWGFASATVSPLDWIFARATYLTHDPRSSANRRQWANVALPLELRLKNPNLYINANPNVTYSVSDHQSAQDITLYSRIGNRTSLFFNGLRADSAFSSIDYLGNGNGALRHSYDAGVQYDITPQLPLGYTYRTVNYSQSTMQRHELSAAARFQRFPNLDLRYSRTDTRADLFLAPADTTQTAVYDTVDQEKDNLRIRIYETSSPWVEKFLHLNRLSYDFSMSRFVNYDRTDSQRMAGSVLYGNGTITPLSGLSVSATGLYRNNPHSMAIARQIEPSLIVQGNDLPPGLDFNAQYLVGFTVFSGDSSAAASTRSLQLNLRPGSWVRQLSWICPQAALTQFVTCAYPLTEPSIADLVTAQDHRTSAVLTRSVGAQIFPVDQIILRTDNSWTSSDSTLIFATDNQARWWVGNRGLLQIQWKYSDDFTSASNHGGSLTYDKVWRNWLKTSQGLTAAYGTDTAGVRAQAGPKIAFYLTLRNLAIIKMLDNSHFFTVAWSSLNGAISPSPDFNYYSYLRFNLFSKFSLGTIHSVNIKAGTFINYTAEFQASLAF